MKRHIGLVLITWFSVCSVVAASDQANQRNRGAVVKIDSGLVEGTHSPAYPPLVSFLGIPYAAPPVGELRWKPPQPPTRWDGTRKADELGPACPQPDFMFRARQRIMTTLGGDPSVVTPLGRTSEDCLYLNVMTTRQDRKELYPVMVFIHGGSGVIGRGDEDGATLALKGVVVVTINYRLGVLGWMSHPALTAESPHHSSGNYGLLDQIAALQWVCRNIAQFGGDPTRVTVFGHSSGGEYVGCLMVSPLARGLFHRAIMQSGVPFDLLESVHPSIGGKASAEKLGVNLALKLAAGDGSAAVKNLRLIPADQLVKNNGPYGAVVDGWVIPDQPLYMFGRGQQADMPIIVGSTEREFSNLIALIPERTSDAFREWVRHSFAPIGDDVLRIYATPSSTDATQSFIRAATELEMVAPARWAARATQVMKSRAYLYQVTWAFPGQGGQQLGAFHGIDVWLLFNSPRMPRDKAGDSLAEALRSYWVQFAKTGDPNMPGLSTWPAYDSPTGAYLELGTQINPASGLHQEAFELLDRLYTKRLMLLADASSDPLRRASLNEEACVSNLRTINTAQVTYWGGDPNGDFASKLEELGPNGAGLIDQVLASGEHNGYVFVLTPGPPDANNHITHYMLSARPIIFGVTGERSFITDDSGVIRYTSEDRASTVADPPIS
ncbi:MAG: carboxylesterase family protein [Acidobacteriia bacterium]|nr:carboxylesterase family protein [Terriglobia bacterium]